MKKLMVVLIPFCLCGCYIQSINPFCSEEMKTELPRIHGEWKSLVQLGKNSSDREIDPWKFTADRIETYDEHNVFSELETTYFKIGDAYFMDFIAGDPFPIRRKVGNIYWSAGVTFVHSLCRIRFPDDNRMIIIPLNPEWFVEQMKSGNPLMDFARRDMESGLVSLASTEQWVEFIKSRMDDPDVFNDKYKFEFERITDKREDASGA